ncbi:MAG: methyltransferase [Acidimicrobiales bacterium]|nr:MAG: methyltransferase [Acidimicrobiales bacterium]
MSFDVAGDAYDRFMGRYSGPLASTFVDFAGPEASADVLDVGCGPGALTAELVARFGAGSVRAVDPSPSFVRVMHERFPEVAVEEAGAASLPFTTGQFDAVLSQLVVHFMADPVAGIAEMSRVTRPGGVVSACVWDHAEGGGPLETFWQAARTLDPETTTEDRLPGTRQGDLTEIFTQAGLEQVDERPLTVRVSHPSFEEWWQPYTLGVGPAGAHVAALDDGATEALRAECLQRLGDGPFVVDARVWAARGRS